MSMQAMLQAMVELKIAYIDPDAQRHVQLLVALRPETGANGYLVLKDVCAYI